jgi:hypothetical protein
MLKIIITQLLLVVSVVIGVPCAFFGCFGLAGRLVDISHSEKVRIGLQLVAIAIFVWGATGVWIWWSSRHDFSRRFSMRSLMIAVTAIACVMGLFAALHLN